MRAEQRQSRLAEGEMIKADYSLTTRTGHRLEPCLQGIVRGLRQSYDDTCEEPLPDHLAQLLAQLDTQEPSDSDG